MRSDGREGLVELVHGVLARHEHEGVLSVGGDLDVLSQRVQEMEDGDGDILHPRAVIRHAQEARQYRT